MDNGTETSNAEATASPSRPFLDTIRLDVIALALTPVLVVIQGNQFGVGYEDLLITAIKRLDDPGWLISDWRMAGAPFHPQLLGPLSTISHFLGFPLAFLMIHLATRLFLLMGTWRLSEAMLPGRPWVAALAMVATLLEPRFRVGSHYLQGGHWEPGYLGMAFSVWIIASLIDWSEKRRHWTSPALLGGLGVAAHLFIALPVFGVGLAAAALRRREWKMPLAILAMGLLLGSISWFPAAKDFFFPGREPMTGAQVIQLLQFRHPHHHQPWTWPLKDFLQAGLILAFGVWAWWRWADDRRKLLVPGVLFAWFIVSSIIFTVAGRLQVIPILAFLQPFRLLSLFLLMTQIAVLEATRRMQEKGDFLHFLILGMSSLLLLYLKGPWGIALLAVLAYLARALWMTRENPEPRQLPRWVFMLTPVGLVAGLTGIAIFQNSVSARSLADQVHPGHWLIEIGPRSSARQQLVQWVKLHTNPESVFAIPPAMQSFRLWEERAIVVDLHNVPYRNAELNEWGERIALGSNVDPWKPFVAIPSSDASPSQLIIFGKTYGADYVVLREKYEGPGLLFENGTFWVVDLRATGV